MKLMPKSKASKINTNWLLLGWVLLLAILTLTLFFNYDAWKIEVKNNNPMWCDRYEYYLNISHNTSEECLMECWRQFGCDHNATGVISKNTCTCNGFPIKGTAWESENDKWWMNYNGTR